MDFYLWLVAQYGPSFVILGCGVLLAYLALRQAKAIKEGAPEFAVFMERLLESSDSIATSLRLLVGQRNQPKRSLRIGADDSLTRWYFVTPDRFAGRVGSDMGENLLVLWLTDEHGQKLNILRETFGARGGLVQVSRTATYGWRFFGTLAALELAMGWEPQAKRVGAIPVEAEDDPTQFGADEG